MLPLDVQAAPSRARPSRRRARARAGAARRPRRRSPRRWRAPSGRRSSRGRGAVLSGAGPALRRLGELTRRRAGDLRGGQRAVRRRPVRGRDLRRLRVADRAAAARASPTSSIAFGAALNMWTTRHGGADRAGRRRVIQVDRDEEAIGAHRPVDLGRRRRRARDRRGARRRARTARGATSARRGAASRSPPRSPPGAGATSRTRRSRDWLDPRDALDRARRPAARRAHRRRRLRRVHGLPVDVPAGPGRAGLRLPAGASSASGSALGNAIGAAIARPDRLTVARGRRRRAADGAARPGDARPAASRTCSS